MKIAKIILTFTLGGLVALFVGLNIWGYLTLGTLQPAVSAQRDDNANEVVMIFGATGAAGGGLLVAAIKDPDVDKVYVVTRRSTPLLEASMDSDKVEIRRHEDFTDYSSLADILPEVNTVLWALGTSSLQVDEATYTRIHVDFPQAFLRQWLDARQAAPMSFHFIAGMGTDGDAKWALDKRNTESEAARLAAGTGLRTFSYRSGFIRPADMQSNSFHYALEALLTPGHMAISSEELGGAMLEISARTSELANGTLIDNADSIAYAQAYSQSRSK